MPWSGAQVPFEPLPPETYGGNVRAQQVLTFAHGPGASTLQAYVEITRDHLLLVGTTALGQRVLSIREDAQGFHAESALPEAALDPKQVLTDLQLATWPAAALRAALGKDWSVDESVPGTRRVLHGGEPYAEVHYAGSSPWRGHVWLVSWAGQYTLSIESKTVK